MIRPIAFQTEKEDYLWRLSTISEKILWKNIFPFDRKPKFPEFLAKWSARLDRTSRERVLSEVKGDINSGMSTAKKGLSNAEKMKRWREQKIKKKKA